MSREPYSMGMAALHLSRRLTGNAADVHRGLAKLGIPIEQMSGASPEQLLSLICQRLRAVPGAPEQMDIAADLLGPNGVKLLPALIGEAR